MQLNIKSEEDLQKVVGAHFGGGTFSFQQCLNILESLAIRQARGQLSKDNKALIAKLEVLNEAQPSRH